MLDDDERHLAMEFFAAGYLAAEPEPPRNEQTREEAARAVAAEHLSQYLGGACLDCGRSGVVTMGAFCERCHWPVEEAAPGLFGDNRVDPLEEDGWADGLAAVNTGGPPAEPDDPLEDAETEEVRFAEDAGPLMEVEREKLVSVVEEHREVFDGPVCPQCGLPMLGRDTEEGPWCVKDHGDAGVAWVVLDGNDNPVGFSEDQTEAEDLADRNGRGCRAEPVRRVAGGEE